MTFSRKTSPLKKALSLVEPIYETIRLLRQTTDRRITLRTEVAPDLYLVEADEGQMNQVLMNLCVNAVDAVTQRLEEPESWDDPAGGPEVLVGARNLFLSEEELDPDAATGPGRYVMFRVADQGCGMEEETRKRIFEPFFTTKPVDQGTGLGLSTVYGIVKQHQGWISVVSAPGQGSEFKVFLPAVASRACAAAPSPSETPLPYGTETVLLVDDEALIRDFGREFLESLGYTVLLAEDGGKAVEVYEARRDEIALIVMDLVMPRVSGLEALARIKEISPQVKVIISSGHSPEEQVSGRLSPAPTAFLSKPYHIKELAETVRKVLDET
ncbi:MAG: response regulator [Thermodesulfobacteriota bacterium]